MKCEGFLVVIISLMTFFSCSMEDDPIMNNMDNVPTNTSERYASFNVNLLSEIAALTRTSVSNGGTDDSKTEQEITNAVIFLLDGDDVENVKVANSKEEINQLSFYTKMQDGKSLFAVTNVSNDVVKALNVCKTLSDIQNVKLLNVDLSKSPKASMEPTFISFVDFVDNGNGVYVSDKPTAIKVAQRTARIELASFNVIRNSDFTKTVDVTLKAVTLCNVNQEGFVGKGNIVSLVESSIWDFKSTFPSCNTNDASCQSSSGKNILAEQNSIFFRTFAYDYSQVNKNQQLYLELTYQIGLKERTKQIVIQGSELGKLAVASNYIYRVHLTAIVRPEQVDLDVIFSIDKWIDGGLLIDGPLTEKEK